MSDALARPRRRLGIVGMLALAAAIAASDARAAAMIESYPMVNQMMEGKATTFTLRFDRPVDHRSALLTLVTPQGERRLAVRLRTEPQALYTDVGPLRPGKYELRWRARESNGEVSSGSIPFMVGGK